MAGQLWAVDADGGYAYSDELSDVLRTQVQPLTKFRQLCDADDASEKGLGRGDNYNWNVYSKISNQGGRLSETEQMPESGFTISQRSLTVYEFGNSVPYTGKLQMLAKHQIISIIDRTLKDDCRKAMDIEAWQQFDSTPLRASVTTGTTSITLDTDGTATDTNNVAFGTGHAKAIVDTMKERNIPAFRADDYVAIGRPSAFRNFKNSLEAIHQYTETGLGMIFSGEIGRYESTRYIEQTFIPSGGAEDSTTFSPSTETGDAWNNAKSDWIFFMGNDTVMEASVVMEEIRAKLPGDYGRSKGIAWYAITGFGLVHTDATNARIVKWDSAA